MRLEAVTAGPVGDLSRPCSRARAPRGTCWKTFGEPGASLLKRTHTHRCFYVSRTRSHIPAPPSVEKTDADPQTVLGSGRSPIRSVQRVTPPSALPSPSPHLHLRPPGTHRTSRSTSLQPRRKATPVRPEALTSSRMGLRRNGPGGANSQGDGPGSGITAPGASQGSSAVQWGSAGGLSQEERVSAWLALPLRRRCPKYPAHDSAPI